MITGLAKNFTRFKGREFLKISKVKEDLTTNIITKSKKTKGKAALYIHIPFCKNLCKFCTFNTYRFEKNQAKKYFKNLKKEIDIYAKNKVEFADSYIGGGTPTILLDELIDMIKYIKKKLKIKRISVETIIEDLNQETVKKLKKAGVKRLSVGVQSFLSKTQKRSGRKTYDVTKAIKRILSAKDYFDTLSIDIIFNFKGQKIEFFKEDLKIFSELKLNQGTFYPLMDLKQSKEELRKEKEMYKILIDTMKKNEYTPSTVWCFSKGENIIDEYIVEYDNYVGLGPGAFSYLDGTLYANTFQLDKYEEILTQESIPAVLTKNVSKKDRMYYSLLTSLFSTKIDKKSFEKKFKKPIKKALFKELTVLKLFGFLKEDKTSFVLKPRGYYFVSVIAKEFFTSLNNLRDYCKKNKL